MHLRDKPECEAYTAPMDLTFAEDETANTVIQPDIFVVCGSIKGDKRVIGTPVLVIEILSPSTARHDIIRKFTLYQKAGVKEYWIVDPENGRVDVFTHDGTGFDPGRRCVKGDKIAPAAFPDLTVDLDVIFPWIETLPEGDAPDDPRPEEPGSEELARNRD